MWQEEKMDIIRLWENQKDEKKEEERKVSLKKLNGIKGLLLIVGDPKEE